MRRSSPVQQWLDSLPAEIEHSEVESTDRPEEISEIKSDDSKTEHTLTEDTVIEPTDKTIVEPTPDQPLEENSINDYSHEDSNLDVPNPRDLWKRKSLESGVLISTPQHGNLKKLQRDHSVQSEGYAPKFKKPLLKDHSLQSDTSGSSGSSVLNVLGARKVDAESVLLALGFGPSEKQQKLQRIPDRFLAPSKLKGISTEKFIKDEHHSMRMHDCGVFGYRGLTGRPHVPPSTIVAKIMDCILHNDDVSREEALVRARHSIADIRSPPVVHTRFTSRLSYN